MFVGLSLFCFCLSLWFDCYLLFCFVIGSFVFCVIVWLVWVSLLWWFMLGLSLEFEFVLLIVYDCAGALFAG